MRHLSLAPARRALAWRVAAAGTLTLGYLDLVGGGITLAPALLILAYLVLVPAALLTWP